jgi:predicted MFS family arabinose efflux permease
VSFLAVLLGLAKMEAPAKPRKPRTGNLWSHLGEGVRYIRGERTVSTLLLQATAVGIFGIPYATLMPVMADQVLGLNASGYGYLLSAIGVGAVCGALTLASLGNTRYKGRIYSIGDAVFPVALFLFTLSRSLGLSVLLLAVMGAGLITRNALTNTLIQTSVPDELRGRVISVYMLMFTGMTPFGALLSGFLAQSFGAPAALRAGAVVLMGTSLLVYWRRPEVRRL